MRRSKNSGEKQKAVKGLVDIWTSAEINAKNKAFLVITLFQ